MVIKHFMACFLVVNSPICCVSQSSLETPHELSGQYRLPWYCVSVPYFEIDNRIILTIFLPVMGLPHRNTPSSSFITEAFNQFFSFFLELSPLRLAYSSLKLVAKYPKGAIVGCCGGLRSVRVPLAEVLVFYLVKKPKAFFY